MAYCRCLLLRGYASAATGSQSPAELPLCTARRVEEVSPVFRHRLELVVREPATAGCGFEPPTALFRAPLLTKYPQSSPLTEFSQTGSYEGTASVVPMKNLEIKA